MMNRLLEALHSSAATTDTALAAQITAACGEKGWV